MHCSPTNKLLGGLYERLGLLSKPVLQVNEGSGSRHGLARGRGLFQLWTQGGEKRGGKGEGGGREGGEGGGREGGEGRGESNEEKGEKDGEGEGGGREGGEGGGREGGEGRGESSEEKGEKDGEGGRGGEWGEGREERGKGREQISYMYMYVELGK